MSFSFVAHSPDNSFLGFAVPSKAQENNISRNKPNNRALVYGKVPAFWKVSPTKIFKSNYSSFEWRRMVKYQCSERPQDGPTCLMSTTIQQIALSDGRLRRDVSVIILPVNSIISIPLRSSTLTPLP